MYSFASLSISGQTHEYVDTTKENAICCCKKQISCGFADNFDNVTTKFIINNMTDA